MEYDVTSRRQAKRGDMPCASCFVMQCGCCSLNYGRSVAEYDALGVQYSALLCRTFHLICRACMFFVSYFVLIFLSGVAWRGVDSVTRDHNSHTMNTVSTSLCEEKKNAFIFASTARPVAHLCRPRGMCSISNRTVGQTSMPWARPSGGSATHDMKPCGNILDKPKDCYCCPVCFCHTPCCVVSLRFGG